jgi:alpha-galactosidase
MKGQTHTRMSHVHAYLAVLGLLAVHGLDNSLGARPGMGWNSDYCTACVRPKDSEGTLTGFQYDSFIRHIADTLNSSGLQALGYQYVNMDASWDTPNRSSSTGDLVPDPALWPQGIESVIGYVHSKGLGFGLYGAFF